MNKSTKIILGIILILVIVLIAAGNYFYSYAVVPAKKDFLASGSEKKSAERIRAEDWFNDKNNRSDWQLTSNDGLKLSAYYLPAKKSNTKQRLLPTDIWDKLQICRNTRKSIMTLVIMC